jgi:drug/metabolite transporter (DMT)-like permease
MSRNHFPPTVLLAVAACLLWSTAFVAIKVGLRYSGPFSFAGLRFMLSGVMLVPFWWGRRPAPDRLCTHGRLLLAVAFFQTFVLYGLF